MTNKHPQFPNFEQMLLRLVESKQAKLTRLYEFHKGVPSGLPSGDYLCNACHQEWPCKTIRVVEGIPDAKL